MAQKQEFVRAEGTVVKIDRIAGTFAAPSGDQVNYDYFEIRVLSDEYDLAHVRFPVDGSVKLPTEGERVSIRCEARPAGGNVRLSARHVDEGTYSDLIASAANAA